MSACREGGAAIERALRQLDRSYFGVLFRESLRGLREQESARDLVQETFIKVWLRCATFQGDSELLPWIRSILRHGLLDRLRKSAGEVALDAAEGQPFETERRIAELSEESIPQPDSEATRAQLDACFQRCWRRFESASPSHALVMAWIVEDGLDHAQIGELLGRTPGATREFISQCRKRARLHLAEWYELAFGTRETA
ncbi:MAG TPA: sigma-70 family RNA polymerase sigma factor [Steroidobacteraceae bacterium]|nr:sigma-70 family RNA polymerase sigma factor [Steroidobacteraceae bacterium]